MDQEISQPQEHQEISDKNQLLFINGNLVAPCTDREELTNFFGRIAWGSVNQDKEYLLALADMLQGPVFKDKPVIIITDNDVRDNLRCVTRKEDLKNTDLHFQPCDSKNKGIGFPLSWDRMWQNMTGHCRIRLQQSELTRKGQTPAGVYICDLIIRLEYARLDYEEGWASRTVYTIPDYLTYVVTRKDGRPMRKHDGNYLKTLSKELPREMPKDYNLKISVIDEELAADCLLQTFYELHPKLRLLADRRFETAHIISKIRHPEIKGASPYGLFNLIKNNRVMGIVDLKK